MVGVIRFFWSFSLKASSWDGLKHGNKKNKNTHADTKIKKTTNLKDAIWKREQLNNPTYFILLKLGHLLTIRLITTYPNPAVKKTLLQGTPSASLGASCGGEAGWWFVWDFWKPRAVRNTLQGINISHLGKRKIIFKMPFLGDMLVPWRVPVEASFLSPTGKWDKKPKICLKRPLRNPWNLTVRPWKGRRTKRKVLFEPSFFRGKLLIFGGVILSRSYLLRFWFFVGRIGVFWKHLLVKACWVDHRSRGRNKVGHLPVINEVIVPINGLING